HLLRHQNNVKPGVAPLIYRFDGRRTFELLMEGVDSLSASLLNRLYSPGLQRQLLLVTLGTILVALIPLMRGGWLTPAFSTPANLFFLTLWLAGSACAIGAARQAKFHRLATLALSGGAGLATALTFAWFSAPDLALTQLAVEVVTVALILLGLRWLPPRIEANDGSAPLNARTLVRRSRDLVVAIAAGAGMSVLA